MNTTQDAASGRPGQAEAPRPDATIPLLRGNREGTDTMPAGRRGKVSDRMPIDDWFAELDRLGGDRYGPDGITANTGRECWMDYYNDGYSPADALSEDGTYWDDDE